METSGRLERWSEIFWSSYWPRRAQAVALVCGAILTVVLHISVPSPIGTITAMLLGIVTPFRFLLGLILLTFGVALAVPWPIAVPSPGQAVVLVAVLTIGSAMILWDWHAARSGLPEPDPVPVVEHYVTPTPKWAVELGGVFVVWGPLIFAVVAIGLYLLIGRFDLT